MASLIAPGPVLVVQESQCRDIDPQNPDHLCHLWSVFSKASPALENGERLQNMTWRLWNRETLRLRRSIPSRTARESTQSTSTKPIVSSSASIQVPELSRSVDSRSSQEDEEVLRTPKERHFTPLDLQNLLHSIKEKQDLPIPPKKQPSRPHSPSPAAPQNILTASTTSTAPASSLCSPQRTATESSASTVATATDSFNSTAACSETSVSSEGSSHSVVRGFMPGSGVTSYTSKSPLVPVVAAQATPTTESKAPLTARKRKSGMFLLGSSSGEDEESFREQMSIRSVMGTTPRQDSNESQKKTSFQDEVLIMRESRQRRPSAVFDSDSETASGEEASESAIDDDEDAWEDDDVSENAKEAAEKEIQFPRVDSKANIASRRSMLTMNLVGQQTNRDSQGPPGTISTLHKSTPAMRRSRTSTPNGPSIPASPTEQDSIMQRRAAQMQSSRPLIPTTTNISAVPTSTSPKTTKRNMLSGELSESLRMNMLSERKQKNPLGLIQQQMKRAHTSNDVSKLSRLAESNVETGQSFDSANTNSSNTPTTPRRALQHPNYYFNHSVGEYHQAGW